MFGKKSNPNADLELFTIYDSKSQSYGNPVYAPNSDVMKREMLNMFRRDKEQNPHYMNAEDFSIFKIGTYDKRTGLISSSNLEHVVNLHDLRSLVGDVGIERT